MYAIIRAGGKQYTVRAGDTLRVEKLPKELGTEFDLDEVLFVGGEKIHVGEPTVKDATVTVVVTQQAKSPKLIVFKKKRRQGYRRLHGHRQLFTELFIKTIKSPSGEVSEAEKQALVIDPAKKLARQEAFAARPKKTAAEKLEAKEKKQARRAGAKKRVAKKVATKAKTKKAAGAKKKTVKKAAKK